MSYYLVSALLLGLSAGLAPGPLLSLVIRESLRHGTGAGMRVAVAPLISDAPIILLSLLMLGQLADADLLLGLLALAGAVMVLFLAYETWQSRLPSSQETGDIAPGSLWRAVGVNLLNPQPYIFWMTVGGPIILTDTESPVGAAIFMVVFYGLLVGMKLVLAYAMGYHRNLLMGRGYHRVMSVLGALLGLFALSLFYRGLDLVGVL